MMNISKPMIDLIKEIRRRCPSDIKPSIKLANPDVIDEILVLYHESSDTIFKALVKELCHIAGSPWVESLTKPQDNAGQFITKTYRGQTIYEPINTEVKEKDTRQKSVKMYRGVAIK